MYCVLEHLHGELNDLVNDLSVAFKYRYCPIAKERSYYHYHIVPLLLPEIRAYKKAIKILENAK